jgi:hypothetical protein
MSQKTGVEFERLRDAVNAQKSPPGKRAFSAMQVIVDYRIAPCSVTHSVRSGDHVFDMEMPFVQDYEKSPVNAFALRDNFLRAQGWSGAFDFLRVTGPFSQVSKTLTLREFERWQEFTRLVAVKETREAISSALREGNWKGDFAETLNALTGLYPSSFFDGLGPKKDPEFTAWLAEMESSSPEIASGIRKGQRKNDEQSVIRRKALSAWFRRPPDNACSLRWIPKGPEEWKEALELLKAKRVLLDAEGRPGLEFSLPRTALMPVFVIEARCSLQAIAASIYADYWEGVEYKKCPECGKVFLLGAGKRVGRWQEREHCSGKCRQAGVNRNRPKKEGKRASKFVLRSNGDQKPGATRKERAK